MEQIMIVKLENESTYRPSCRTGMMRASVDQLEKKSRDTKKKRKTREKGKQPAGDREPSLAASCSLLPAAELLWDLLGPKMNGRT